MIRNENIHSLIVLFEGFKISGFFRYLIFYEWSIPYHITDILLKIAAAEMHLALTFCVIYAPRASIPWNLTVQIHMFKPNYEKQRIAEAKKMLRLKGYPRRPYENSYFLIENLLAYVSTK